MKRAALAAWGLVWALSSSVVMGASGDADLDGDVDLLDVQVYLLCIGDGIARGENGESGEGVGAGAVMPECAVFDFNEDLFLDFADFAGLQRAFTGDGPVEGSMDVEWINGGPNCGSEPAIQVHRYNDDTYILRQSLCTNFEGPFMYLLFGEDRVFMQDTGAGGIAIADTVYGIIDDWLIEQGRGSIELIVTHSHSHGDHTAGDSQFNGQPNTTVVGLSVGAVQSFFSITGWPQQIVQYDLGGRYLDIIPIPGHQSAHIAVYDRRTDMLLTGDTLYPGRLYISQWPAYQESIQRMVDFGGENNVHRVMGTHIEMTNTPGKDYPFGATHHPDEHVLQLDFCHLVELNDAVQAMDNGPEYEEHDDFIIFPLINGACCGGVPSSQVETASGAAAMGRTGE